MVSQTMIYTLILQEGSNITKMKLVIFGCGIIANRIAKSCKLAEGLELLGFGSKDIEKAKEYSKLYECPQYGDYDYFLNSDVDTVYIATHNPSHYSIAKMCLQHGKNVICEKPMFSLKEEYDELYQYAHEHNLIIMEALKSVFLPLNIKIKELVNAGAIGTVKEISASFIKASHFADTHWIYEKKTGGVLKDLGTYCIGTMNFILDKKPKFVFLESNATETRAETDCKVIVDYNGIRGYMEASNVRDGKSALIIKGTKGYIESEFFWKTGKGFIESNGTRTQLDEELISDFYYELKHYCYLFEHKILESPIMSLEASKNILEITEKSI